MKYILIIGDGMADVPVPELGGKTPLEYAAIPNMDRLASAGEIGSVLTVPEGLPAGSDTAILSIFGCDPRVTYSGRAPLEAAASGLSLAPGDVCYRCNMVTFEDKDCDFEEKKLLSHSAGSIEGEESIELILELFDSPEFSKAAQLARLSIHPTPSFRHLAVQKSADIKDLTLKPPHDHLGETLETLLPKGGSNAPVLDNLMRIAHEMLQNHPLNEKRRAEGKLPANGIWFWAEGTAAELPDFTVKYGKTGGVISAVQLCQGIAVLSGLEKIIVEGATGELDTNYEGKAEAALDLLKSHDFATIHVEAPDECTHNGDTKGKIQAIEWIDSRVLPVLMEGLDATGEKFRILILSDHRTLTSTCGHDGEPVPYIIYDSRIGKSLDDNRTLTSFCEAQAAKGRYLSDGTMLMDLLFERDESNERN